MDRPGEIAQLHALIAELLNATVDEIGEIDPDEPLMNYGMDSLRVMSLVQRLDAVGLPSDFIAMMTDQTLASWESIVVGESSRNSVRQIEFAAWHGGHAERGGLAMSVETSAASRQWAPLEQPRAGFCPMPPIALSIMYGRGCGAGSPSTTSSPGSCVIMRTGWPSPMGRGP